MTGFEFAKQFDNAEEKMIVLFMDAAKTDYNMDGMDFDRLPEQEKNGHRLQDDDDVKAANNRPQMSC